MLVSSPPLSVQGTGSPGVSPVGLTVTTAPSTSSLYHKPVGPPSPGASGPPTFTVSSGHGLSSNVIVSGALNSVRSRWQTGASVGPVTLWQPLTPVTL